MAYPAVPQRRIEYDQDGTVVRAILASTGQIAATMTAGNDELIRINDEYTSDLIWRGNQPPGYQQSGWNNPGAMYVLMQFPVPMDITHMLMYYANATVAVSWSADSTDGLDGTWTAINLDTTGIRQTGFEGWAYQYRDGIAAKTGVPAVPATISGAKFLRLYHTFNDNNYAVYLWHIYGYPTGLSNGTGVEALRLWHATNDAWLHYNTDLNLGAVAQGSYATLSFRVKNVGSVSRANCTVSMNTNTYAESALVSGAQFSTDNATWFSNINLGTLAAGAVSSVVYCRIPTTTATPLTPHSVRIQVVGT